MNQNIGDPNVAVVKATRRANFLGVCHGNETSSHACNFPFT